MWKTVTLLQMRFGIILGLLVVGMGTASVTYAKNPDYASYSKVKIGKAWYHVIKLDITREEITPTAHYSPRLTSFWKVAGKSQPVAAITGTFFAFENQQPVADVVVDGVQKAKGYRGSALTVDWFGRLQIVDIPTKTKMDYEPFRYALRGMIRVLSDGEVKPNPKAQGFTDRSIWGSAARTAVGITGNNKLIMMATSNAVTLSTVGKALKNQGATNGVCLDGGGSTMLYYMGDVKVTPNRSLSTLFMVEKRSAFDDLFKRRWDERKLQDTAALFTR